MENIFFPLITQLVWWVLAATRLLHNLCHFSAAFKDFTNVIIKTGNCALLGSSGIRRLGTLRTVYNSVLVYTLDLVSDMELIQMLLTTQ